MKINPVSLQQKIYEMLVIRVRPLVVLLVRWLPVCRTAVWPHQHIESSHSLGEDFARTKGGFRCGEDDSLKVAGSAVEWPGGGSSLQRSARGLTLQPLVQQEVNP